jgi:tRNA A-37 threonylcarbamoyl transferase component Bud32
MTAQPLNQQLDQQLAQQLQADDERFHGTVIGKELIDLLKMLHRICASGVLHLDAEVNRASLCLDGGALRAAFFNDLSGASALTRIILIGRAHFRFEIATAHTVANYARNISKDTALILSTVEMMLAEAENAEAKTDHKTAIPGTTPVEKDTRSLRVAAPVNPLTGKITESDALQTVATAAAATAAATTAATSASNQITSHGEDDYLPPSTSLYTAKPNNLDKTEKLSHAIDATTLRIATFLPPEPGALIGKCELMQVIGHGASSIVYRAKHRSLACDVVLKILLPENDDAQHNRLLTINEARLLARLNHPNILRVFDFTDVGRWPHIITELVDGPSFAKLIKERRVLPTDIALPLMCQTAEALSYAHATMHVVHCDIKPENILLSQAMQVKLADFGLAKSDITIPDLAQAFPAGVVAGSPSYIAPEQVEGGRDACDLRSDMYALGATMYHAVTGRTPFNDPDPVQLMVKRLSEAPIPPHLVNPKIERRVSQLIMSMMARDPNNRIQTWDELLELMGDLIDSLAPSTDRYHTAGDASNNVIRRRTSFWNYVPNRLFRRGSTGQQDVG